MCRNIRTLFNFEPPATDDEVQAAALQYVRKVGGYSKVSIVNQDAHEQAVAEVTAATNKLLASLSTKATPKNREVEAAKAKKRAASRVTHSMQKVLSIAVSPIN